jgi:predicted house-cleaning noncanonical NTP pyrophosphatase (MazG superfamily)
MTSSNHQESESELRERLRAHLAEEYEASEQIADMSVESLVEVLESIVPNMPKDARLRLASSIQQEFHHGQKD